MRGYKKTFGPEELLMAAVADLKLPISLIKGLSENLQSNAYQSSAEKLQAIDRIALNSSSLIALLDAVEIMQSAHQDQSYLELEPINPKHSLESVINQLQPLLSARKKRLEVSLPNDLPTIISNKVALETSLRILFEQALSPVEPDHSIYVSAARRGEKVSLNCTDQSRLISAKEFKRAVLSPQDFKVPIKAYPHSSGAVLVLANEILNSMQAEFAFSSSSKGSVYSVTLPRVAQLSLL